MRRFGCAAILLGFIGGLIGQSSYPHTLLLLAIGIYFVLPLLGVCGVIAALSTIRRAPRPWLLPTFIGLLWAIAALLVSHGVGSGAYTWEKHRAATFISDAQDALDKIKATTGKYPLSLPPDLKRHTPAWLKRPDSYRSDGETFTFSYKEPRAMLFGTWTYYSVAKRWQYDH